MKIINNIAAMGFSGIYPENTMLAYEKALESGANVLEVDAYLTKDQVVVLSHDATIDRTTDGTGLISDYSYSELSQFNAAFHYMNGTDRSGPGGFEHIYFVPQEDEMISASLAFSPIPKLEDVLHLLQNNEASLLIEIKSHVGSEAGIGEIICGLIRQYGLESRCILSSYDHPYIHELSMKEPAIRYSVMFMGQLLDAGKYVKELGASVFQNCLFSLDNISQTVQTCNENGIELWIWSPGVRDTIEHNQKLLDAGVTGIITHYPNNLAPLVAER